MAASKKSYDIAERRAARLGAVQALYQMDMNDVSSEAVIEEFVTHRLGQSLEGVDYAEADEGHFAEIIRGVVESQVKIDRQIENSLADGWTMSRIDSILRAILRCAGFELLCAPHIPAAVVINEYLDVAHAFFENDEPKFVNGMLDRMARELRADEMALGPKR
jgi:N utilization substance protein B